MLPHLSVKTSAGSQAALIGEHKKITEKMSAKSHVTVEIPTKMVARFMVGLSKIRRYMSKIEIFTNDIVDP